METKRIEDKEDVNKIKVKRPDLIIRTNYKLWEYLFKDQQKKTKRSFTYSRRELSNGILQ